MIYHEVKKLEEELKAYKQIATFFINKFKIKLNEEEFEELRESLKTVRLNKIFRHCNFPLDCQDYDECTIKKCNYDVCSNGYCYRMS